MNTKQEYTPKYWVMHDTATDDIYTSTMSKSHAGCIAKFTKLQDQSGDTLVSELYMKAFPELDGYWMAEVMEWFYIHPTLECSLIEIKLMKCKSLEDHLDTMK